MSSSNSDFLTGLQIEEITTLREVIDVCRHILADTNANVPVEQRKDAFEELVHGHQMYRRLIENIKQ